MKFKNFLLLLLRLVVTLGLLYFIYSKIDFILLKKIILTSNYFYFVIALGIFIISNITGSIQYYYLLKTQKIEKLPFLKIIKIYLFSTFFNNLLPTNIGGDGVRIYQLMQYGINKNIIFSSVIWDRFISILILIVLSLIMGFILLKKVILFIVLLAVIILCTIFVMAILRFNFGKKILKLVQQIKNEKITYFLQEFLMSFKIYIKKGSSTFIYYILSLLTQFLKIFFTYFIGLGMNYPIKIEELLFILPVVGIVSSLPISINGLGLREYVGRILFGYLNKDMAIISIFITLGNIIIMLGNTVGIVFMFGRNKTIRHSTFSS